VLELIGDKVVDLVTSEPVKVMIDQTETPQIIGAKSLYVYNAEEMQECIRYGFEQRKTSGTAKNAQSSRSHFVCKVILATQDGEAEILLVDLAGSERSSETQFHSNEQKKESMMINSSLMVHASKNRLLRTVSGPNHCRKMSRLHASLTAPRS
jgi:kinesin family member 2/24